MPPTPLLPVHCGVPRDRIWGTLEFLRGPFWDSSGACLGPLDVHFAGVFSMFFENPRFDAPSAVSGPRRRRLRRRNADFQKTLRKRLRSGRPESAPGPRGNPKGAPLRREMTPKDPEMQSNAPEWFPERPKMAPERAPPARDRSRHEPARAAQCVGRRWRGPSSLGYSGSARAPWTGKTRVGGMGAAFK